MRIISANQTDSGWKYCLTVYTNPNVISRMHCVKSVQIRSFFWSVFSCIQSESSKLQTRKNLVFRHFPRSDGCLQMCSIFETKHFSFYLLNNCPEFEKKLKIQHYFFYISNFIKRAWIYLNIPTCRTKRVFL